MGPDTIAVDLQTPPEFTAAPGQFVKLQFEIGGETMGRFYTISSPSTTDTFDPIWPRSPSSRRLSPTNVVPENPQFSPTRITAPARRVAKTTG